MPARRHAVLTVEVERLGEPETGLWCESCQLPSSAGFDFAVSLAGRVYSMTRVIVCLDCGRARHP